MLPDASRRANMVRVQPAIRARAPVGLLDRAYYPIGPVMDGYSVKDAALVLGIPERRVWELIARGVLSSSREGPDGMRVFLQPRSTPADHRRRSLASTEPMSPSRSHRTAMAATAGRTR